jgi:hypothetical protein
VRELAGGQQFAGLGEQAPRLALAELGALSGVGAAQQEQGQRALDIGYQQFQEELQYPERTLQEYSSIIRGFPLTPNQFDVKQTATPPPNLGTQLAGLAGAGIAGARAFAKDGGQIKRKAGGLADLPTKRYVKKQEAGSVGEDILLGRRGQNAALQSYLQGIEGLKAESTSLKEQRAALREQQKEDIGRDKFLQLAMAGLQIAEAGGQGKGLLDASIPAAKTALGGLGEARTRERELEAANVEAGFQDKMMELGLTEKQITALTNQETLKAMKLKALTGKTITPSIPKEWKENGPNAEAAQIVINDVAKLTDMDDLFDKLSPQILAEAATLARTLPPKQSNYFCN